MTLPSPAHTLARLAALEAALQAWATAYHVNRAQSTRRTRGQLEHATKVVLALTEPLKPTEPT